MNFADAIPFLFLEFYCISTKSSLEKISEYAFKWLHWIIPFNDILQWKFSELITTYKRGDDSVERNHVKFFSVMIICSQHLLPHHYFANLPSLGVVFTVNAHWKVGFKDTWELWNQRFCLSSFPGFTLKERLNMLMDMLTEILCCRTRFSNIQR